MYIGLKIFGMTSIGDEIIPLGGTIEAFSGIPISYWTPKG
jgi:hypothetical protein